MLSSTNKRILAIDFGTSKIGLAVSDELHITAEELTKIRNDDDVFEQLGSIISKYHIGLIIVGISTKSHLALDEFIKKLKSFTTIEVNTTNEDFSTLEAKKILSQKTKLKSRLAVSKAINDNDSLSAKIFLQRYLENPM